MPHIGILYTNAATRSRRRRQSVVCPPLSCVLYARSCVCLYVCMDVEFRSTLFIFLKKKRAFSIHRCVCKNNVYIISACTGLARVFGYFCANFYTHCRIFSPPFRQRYILFTRRPYIECRCQNSCVPTHTYTGGSIVCRYICIS